MANQRIFLNLLTDLILIGNGQKIKITQAIYTMLQSEPTWVSSLLERVLAHFNGTLTNADKEKIYRFIRQDLQFIEIWKKQRHQLNIYQYNLIPTLYPPAILHCDTPQIQNWKQLSKWLGISLSQLESYSANWRTSSAAKQKHFHHYHYQWIPKKHGHRLIEAPKQRISKIQQQIYQGILEHIPLHKDCHGFRKQHSCRTYVAPHTKKDLVIHMDLDNFFTSISLARIQALFTTIGYPEPVAKCLAGLCCNHVPIEILKQNTNLSWQQRQQFITPHLPQGSPSSPILANLASYKLDVRLAALAKQLNGDYTRYADDLAFSGNTDFKQKTRNLPVLVAHIASTEGFSVNHRKTRFMHQGVSQRLTGMTLNQFPNYPREEYDQLKATLYNCNKFGVSSQNRDNRLNFKAYLQGKIAHIKYLNPKKVTSQ